MKIRAHADLIVRNAIVISMNAQRQIFAPGAVAVAGREINAVGPEAEVVSSFDPVRVIDAGGGPVHPGFIETHMHVSHQLIRGTYSDSLPWDELLETFMLDYWRVIDAEDEFIGSMLGCLEMIRNGTTCFLEAGSVFEPAATAAAAETVGIRALVADGFIWDQGPLANGPLRVARTPAGTEEALAGLGKELWRNDDLDALVRGHVALWGMGTASDEVYKMAKDLARRAGVVLNAHQSFHQLDAEGDRQRLGAPPVCHYHDLGVLDQETTLSHANFIDDNEANRLVSCGSSVAWCPASSMLWATGGSVYGRHAELLRQGCNVALGSDTSTVANPLDLVQAGMLAALVSRDARRRRDALIAEDVFEMATVNAARAVGLADRIGSLEPGKRADLVIRRPDLPELCPRGDIIDQLVYAGSARGVQTVIVDGRVVLEEGAFPNLDEARFRSLGDEAAERLLLRMGWQIRPRWPVVGPASCAAYG